MSDPIPNPQREMMNGLARGIDDVLNGEKEEGVKPRFGFVLLIAEFDNIDGGRVNYISNGERDSMLAMCREYLARAEGRYQEPGTVQ